MSLKDRYINTISEDFFLEVSRGAIPGVELLYKYGRSSDVTTIISTVWDKGGLYSYLSTAQHLSISSSNASDSAVGTGARTIKIYGNDQNFNLISEIISLNGQSGVTTTQSFIRVWRMEVLTAGSGEKAAGTIYAGTGTITAGVPANVYAQIVDGNNKTLMSVYTVPSGYDGYFYFATAAAGQGKEVEFSLWSRQQGSVFRIQATFPFYESQNRFYFKTPIRIFEKEDIEIRATTTIGTINASADFFIILVKKDL